MAVSRIVTTLAMRSRYPATEPLNRVKPIRRMSSTVGLPGNMRELFLLLFRASGPGSFDSAARSILHASCVV
jgi:hypothetical protein